VDYATDPESKSYRIFRLFSSFHTRYNFNNYKIGSPALIRLVFGPFSCYATGIRVSKRSTSKSTSNSRLYYAFVRAKLIPILWCERNSILIYALDIYALENGHSKKSGSASEFTGTPSGTQDFLMTFCNMAQPN